MQDQATSTSSNSSKRSRITRACDTCRRKKIKCDVDSSNPCTTCKQYGWECTFQDAVKKRGPPKGYIESLESRLQKMEKLLKNIGEDNTQSQPQDQPQSQLQQQPQQPQPLSLPQHQYPYQSSPLPQAQLPFQLPQYQQQQMHQYQKPILPHPQQQQQQQTAPTTALTSIHARKKLVRYHGSSSGYYLMGNIIHQKDENEETIHIQHQQEEEDEEKARMEEDPKLFTLNTGPSTYRLRRVNQNDDDLMVVRDLTADEDACQSAIDGQENIEDIVPRSILEALVNVYFSFDHITLPVIDKTEYLDAFQGRTSPPPAPLLTYAICSYACFLISSDDPIFKTAGVERNQVFQILVDRASILVRREYLIPRIITVQALVLLCGHPTYSTSSYRNWILVGMAVRMAQDLGLHRTLTTVEVSEEFRERRKRLWFSVYVTDRWCCALMGRPLAIADSDCDVDLPLTFGPDDAKDYNIFVNFVKLSGILGEVLRRIYSPKAKSNGYQTKSMEHTVWSIHRMLEDWFAGVPSGYKLTEQDVADIAQNPSLYKGTKKIEEGGPLTVCYHAVVLLLHRPFIVLNETDKESFSQVKALCSKTAKLAVDIARIIPHIMISRFGWNFAVYATYQAALIHVYNCTDSDPTISSMAKEYVRICIDECLQPLARDIPAGPPMVPFIQTLLGLVGNNNNNNNNNSSSNNCDTESNAAASNVDTTTAAGAGATAAPNDNMTQPSFLILTPTPTVPVRTSQMPPVLPNEPISSSKMADVDSWLLNGAEGNLSQAAWQQLFSMAGTPFSESNNRTEAQGWDNFFWDNQATFMP